MLNIELRPLLEKLNQPAVRAVHSAVGMCLGRGNYEVAPKHILLKLVEEPNGDVAAIFRQYGIEPSAILKTLQQACEESRTGNPDKPVFSPLIVEWLQESWLLASVELGTGSIRTGGLLAALLANADRYETGSYLDALRVIPPDELRRRFGEITKGSSEEATPAAPKGGLEPRQEGSALQRFTIDFTGRARAGQIDPVFGRDREIRQMVDILGRRRKNNPIAVGEAGVGKTALVEGLALRVALGDVPDFLKDFEIYGLDLGLLQAGAGVKGEFESRLKSVLDEVKGSAKPVILCVLPARLRELRATVR